MTLTDTYFDNIRTIQTFPNGVNTTGQSDGIAPEVAQDIGYGTDVDYQAALVEWQQGNHPEAPHRVGNTALKLSDGVEPLPLNESVLTARRSVRGFHDAASAAHPEEIPGPYVPIDDEAKQANKFGAAEARAALKASTPRDTSAAREALAHTRVTHQTGSSREQLNMQQLMELARTTTDKTSVPHILQRDSTGAWRIMPDSPDQVA